MARRQLKILGVAASLAGLVILTAIAPTLAQSAEVPGVNDPTFAMLAGVTGIIAVVTLITNLLRTIIPADVFDRWGKTIAAAVGMALAVVGLVFAPDAVVNGSTIVQALLIGLFGGWQSQLANAQVVGMLRGGDTPRV